MAGEKKAAKTRQIRFHRRSDPASLGNLACDRAMLAAQPGSAIGRDFGHC